MPQRRTDVGVLSIVCAAGFLDNEALARSSSCHRSVYLVCEKELRPAVKKKRYRLFRRVQNATVDRLGWEERTDLRELEIIRHNLNNSWSRWLETALDLGYGFIDYQLWESALRKQNSVAYLQFLVEIGGREKHKYSRQSLRSFRQLTADQRSDRARYSTRGRWLFLRD